ncbi:MAG: YtxH domain-containing protein [Ferruginibacter sp.]|nr:YtxH domain-containing protein [Ferruginibacter sp.]
MSKKLLAGVLLGAAAGAALGILFAPDKGSATRKKIAKKGSDLTNTIKKRFNALGEALSEKYDDIQEDAQEMIEKGKKKAADKMSDLKDEMQRSLT